MLHTSQKTAKPSSRVSRVLRRKVKDMARTKLSRLAIKSALVLAAVAATVAAVRYVPMKTVVAQTASLRSLMADNLREGGKVAGSAIRKSMPRPETVAMTVNDTANRLATYIH